MINSRRTLIIDVSNILFRVSAMQKAGPYGKEASVEDLVGMSFHVSLQSIFKYYNKYNPDFLVFAFDGDRNWRKDYTAKMKSRLPYKGNRVRDPEMEHYYRLLKEFRTTISLYTSICCISVDTLEADDVIAGFCQLFASPQHEVVIVSGDKDFTQLLKIPGVTLINPDDGKPRNQPTSKEYEPDIDYWIFKKCIRGDGGDNVPSAWPRVRETKIKKAYMSDYDRANFMNERWSQPQFEVHPQTGLPTPVMEADESGNLVQKVNVYRVGDLFEENVVLMDLSKQPPEQRSLIEESVKEQVEKTSTYSHFQFLRFLSNNDLRRVQEDAMKFIDMFTNNQRFLKGEKTEEVKKPVVKKLDVKAQLAELKKSNLLSF